MKEISPGGNRPAANHTPAGGAAAAVVPAAAAAAAASMRPGAFVASVASPFTGAGSGVPSTLWCTSRGRTRPLGRLPRVWWLGGMCGSGSGSGASSLTAAAADPSSDLSAFVEVCCGMGGGATCCCCCCYCCCCACAASLPPPSNRRPGGRRPGLRCVPGSGRTMLQGRHLRWEKMRVQQHGTSVAQAAPAG